jgi:FtsZ-binding cell division protein ZapB
LGHSRAMTNKDESESDDGSDTEADEKFFESYTEELRDIHVKRMKKKACQIAMLEAENSDLKSKVSDLQSAHGKLTTEIAHLKSISNGYDALQQEIGDLEVENLELVTENRTLKKNAEDLQDRISRMVSIGSERVSPLNTCSFIHILK